MDVLAKYSNRELEKLLWEEERTLCLQDLFYLSKYVLGYSELSERIHQPFCDVIQSVNPVVIALRDKQPIPKTLSIGLGKKLGSWVNFDPLSKERLINMFRGSFKTTIASISHTIQLMLIWPDIRILIASHKKEGGSDQILYAIKRHFIGNKKFRSLFPEYCINENSVGQIEWGTSERVTLPNRNPACAWPEATIEIAGATTDVTGRHYDYIKNDDLVTRDSVTNETMISKTREFKALQRFLFNQPEWGITDNVGTPYHFNDMYATMNKSKGITKIRIPALNDKNEPTFPERFTYDGLMAIKNDPTMGSYEFSCQYQMNPVPPEDQTFRPEWLEGLDFHYRELPDNLRFYVFVDPASKRGKKNDYTAIITIGINSYGKKYLVDVIRDKLSPEDRTNLALKICMKRNTHKLYYESIGFQDTDCYIIKKKAKESDWYLEVEELKGTGTTKEDRIRGLQPLYERGDILWPEEYIYFSKYDGRRVDMIPVLRDEMLMFPKCEHDDLIDCHSFLLQISDYSAAKNNNVVKPDDEFEFHRNQIIAKKNPRTSWKLNGSKFKKEGAFPAKISFR